MRALDGDQQEIAVLPDLDAIHQHQRGSPLGPRPRGLGIVRVALARVRGGERLEVLHPDEGRGRLAHGVHVERFPHPPDVGLGERGPAPGDLVDVAACDRAVPRVEPVRRLGGAEYVDVRRQLVVEALNERGRRQVRRHVEVGDLREGVHAGVGTAGAVQLEVLTSGHRPDRPVQFTLDGARVLLDLPAAVAGAGVLDREAIAGHASILRAAADLQPSVWGRLGAVACGRSPTGGRVRGPAASPSPWPCTDAQVRVGLLRSPGERPITSVAALDLTPAGRCGVLGQPAMTMVSMRACVAGVPGLKLATRVSSLLPLTTLLPLGALLGLLLPGLLERAAIG